MLQMDLNIGILPGDLLAVMSVFADSLRQRMRDAGFLQLLTDLRNHGDATVNSVAVSISLSDDVS